MSRPTTNHALDRRDFLRCGAGALAGSVLSLPESRGRENRPEPLRVAAIFTEMTYRSHAHVLLENFLEPYYFDGQATDPGCEVVAFYGDQFPAHRDVAHGIAKAFRIPIYPTIAEALCAGGHDLAVDAVLSIGEHGNYPLNPKGQREYPRRRFFDAIADVCRRNHRAIPVFNDKHLSYRWDWAKSMYDTARELGIPLMAGSSVPLAQRVPAIEIPTGSKILEAVSTHGGGLDSYDFHALEVLQSIVEGRAGGETGVERVQYLSDSALWRAADAGKWSPALLLAACKARPRSGEREWTMEELRRALKWGLLVQYRDGLRALVAKVGDDGTRWNFACRIAGDPRPNATSLQVGPWQNRNLFKALAHAIQAHFRTARPPYPVERTLLTTGLVAAGVESHYRGDIPFETPHLAVAYTSKDFSALRENGASWQAVTEKANEPRGIDRLGKVAFPFEIESTR
jgi:hypothetical protein